MFDFRNKFLLFVLAFSFLLSGNQCELGFCAPASSEECPCEDNSNSCEKLSCEITKISVTNNTLQVSSPVQTVDLFLSLSKVFLAPESNYIIPSCSVSCDIQIPMEHDTVNTHAPNAPPVFSI